MKEILFSLIGMMIFGFASGQEAEEEQIIQTFRHTRIINSHSVETLPASKMDFRVVHRFGNFAGDNGGWPTFYGLESASDVEIGFEYGITDILMVGISRTKGSGPLRQNINNLAKLRVMNQERNGNLPFSLTVVGISSYSTMQKGDIPSQ